ncbi:MAG: ribonuclease E inhibitor RraB [Pirellulaceae bacterium]
MAEYPDDADGEVLADLAAQGVDMSQPLLIDFPVAAADEASATAIGAALTKAGYRFEIEFDEGEPNEDGEIDPDDDEFGPAWTVYVAVQMVPEYAEIMRIQAELDELARPLDGYSDGWGVMLDGDDFEEEEDFEEGEEFEEGEDIET